MFKIVARFAADESGVTSIEYGILAAGVALAIIAIVGSLGGTLNATFTNITAQMAGP